MAKLLADYRTKVDQALQDKAAVLTQAEKDAFIEQAVKEHSKIRPLKKVADIVGSGVFDLALPVSWEKGFSKILSVEFPADEREPVYLEDEDWLIYEKTTGEVLRLINDTPSAAQKVRLNFSARHTVDVATGTIPDADFDAVADFATAFAATALASRYAQLSESTLGADSVDHKSKSQEYRSMAGFRFKLYKEHMGIKEGDPAAAGFATKDWDVNFPWGEDRLTHPRRWR